MPPDIALFDECGEHGRHADEDRWSLAVDDVQDLGGAETRQEDHFGANHEAEIHHRRHAEGMEERQHRDGLLAARRDAWRPERELHRIGVKIGVGQRRPLGMAGGAAGILQHRDVVRRVDRSHLERAIIVDQVLEEDMA